MRDTHTHCHPWKTKPLSREKKDEFAIVLNNLHSGSYSCLAGIRICRCMVYTYFSVIDLLPLVQSLKQ